MVDADELQPIGPRRFARSNPSISRSFARARVAARDRSSISSSRELRRRAEVPIGRVFSVRRRRPAAARPMFLSGAAVTALREQSPGDSRGATGYVLEMSGDAATGSHYASFHHLIVIPHTQRRFAVPFPPQSLSLGATESRRAFGAGGFRQVTRARGDLRALPRQATEAGLPRIAYVGQIFSRQRKPEADEQILYGADTDGMLPTSAASQ